MKKILFILALGFVFASCSNCQDCTLDGVSAEVCEDDFDSNEDYQAALLLLESQGAECK